MKVLRTLAALILALAPAGVQATTLSFGYSGVDQDNPYVRAVGTGTISFDRSGTLTLADLTGFSFTQTTTLSDPGLMGSGTFSYALADLSSFRATVSNGTFSALTLRTRTVADPTGFLAPMSFQIRSLRSNGATTAFDDAGADEATLGTVRIAAVPEPMAWTMVILGVALVGGTARRRRDRGAGALSAA